jgi:large subunit ribosomal protein L3
MSTGIVGRKCGMTRVFTPEGVSLPVSVIEAAPNRITQVKTVDRDGYTAVQVAVGQRRASLINRPEAGHYAKAQVEPGRALVELRVKSAEIGKFSVGGTIAIDQFKEGQLVDVTGTTKGKGFAGTIKRHHFTMGDATHGNSLSHRSPGSIGQRQTPGRVFPGKKMAGQMGNVQQTISGLKVVRVDLERHVLLVHGAIPGAPGGDVVVKPAAKIRPVKVQPVKAAAKKK